MGAIPFLISGRYDMEEKKKINQEEMKKISGGFSPYGGTICDRCGGIKDNPNIPDEQKCHCDEGIYYNPYMSPV